MTPGLRGESLDPHPPVREVLAEHLPGICALELLTFDEVAWQEHVVRQLYLIHGGEWFVVADGPDVWGYALGAICPDGYTAWVLGFAVDPERRGQRIGKELLNHCLGFLFAAGVREVRLTVRADDDNTLRLYRAFGFDIEQHVDDFLGPGRHRYVMVAQLDGSGF